VYLDRDKDTESRPMNPFNEYLDLLREMDLFPQKPFTLYLDTLMLHEMAEAGGAATKSVTGRSAKTPQTTIVLRIGPPILRLVPR
jgi:hypothetical protein